MSAPGPKKEHFSIIVHRVDLFDSGHSDDDRIHNTQLPDAANHPVNSTQPLPPIQTACFDPGTGSPSQQQQQQVNDVNNNSNNNHTRKITRIIHSCRVPPQTHPSPLAHRLLPFPVVDNSTPNPHGPSIDKYWQQRRRLFLRFDQGIELDEEGWFSVTPEQIADHTASRLSELIETEAGTEQLGLDPNEPRPVVLLDAFCGCGGNAIAFAKQPNLVVYAVDTDRSKLRMAAHNAAIYGIPPQKLVLIECNVLFLLEYCFKDGEFVLDQPIESPEKAMALMASMPPPVSCETVEGYNIGGIDLLPRGIDVVFMDPPWGGVDYEVFGKQGYDLVRNMKIKRPATSSPSSPNAAPANQNVGDDFFDSFAPKPLSKKERISQFNCGMDEDSCVNGAELLGLAASATKSRWVIYDCPRNTSHKSIGQAALAAGYRGNCKLEEHYLNRRLKTITAYFGPDWTGLLKNGIVHTSSWRLEMVEDSSQE